MAAKLRERIVSGRLTDGDVLPKQEDLGAEFGVSKPTMREAIRVLESEGLIEVQQGRFGGAVVHVPKVENIAVTMALVLETNGVQLPDVGASAAGDRAVVRTTVRLAHRSASRSWFRGCRRCRIRPLGRRR